jgi:ATP-binding cassette, subfamily G (WHITE), member 2, SNQ2
MDGVKHLSSVPTAASSVNIEQAESAFHELSRQLSQGTFVDDREQGVATAKDIEKGLSDPEQPFDLREYLTSTNDANERAGIKHKHVGVTWDDFHVDVFGGLNFKVSWSASSGRRRC